MIRRITKEELQEIIRKHNLYLLDDENEEAEKADLSYTNLKYANLYNVNLEYANLEGANLECADLRFANLRDTNLRYANLRSAKLSYANLNYTDLYNANLKEAKLDNAKNIPYIPMVCPEVGEFYGYKKVHIGNIKCIAKLYIPAEAKRSSATTRRCRCEFAKVISITSLDGRQAFDEAVSNYDPKFKYKVGETVYPDKFDENRWDECSNGIHFFIQRQEAVNYVN